MLDTPTAMAKIGDGITKVLNDTKTNAEPIAKEAGEGIATNLNDGIAEGMTTETEKVKLSAQELIKFVNDELKSAGDIHSPSGLTETEVGIPLAQGIASGMEKETSSIESSASALMENIVTALSSHIEDVAETIGSMMTTIITNIQNKNENITDSAIELVKSFIEGFTETIPDVEDMLDKFNTDNLKILATVLPDYFDSGVDSLLKIVSGFKSKTSDFIQAVNDISDNVIEKLRSYYESFESAGRYVGDGFVNGISSRIKDAASAGSALGQAAYEAAREALDEHSPSAKMFHVGDFAGLGFIKGVAINVAKAYKAGEELGEAVSDSTEEATSNISKVVNFGEFSEPIITPEVDLTNVEQSTKMIQDLFNRAVRGISFEVGGINSAIDRNNHKTLIGDEDTNSKTDRNVNIELVQNNYSPKALNRDEIYRQTKNQFSRLKGLVSDV